MQVLQRSQASKPHGFLCIKFSQRTPFRLYHFAHPPTHSSNSRQIYGISQILRSEDVRDHEMVGKARDQVLCFGSGRGGRDITARMRIGFLLRVGGHHAVCRAHDVVSSSETFRDSRAFLGRSQKHKVFAMLENPPPRASCATVACHPPRSPGCRDDARYGGRPGPILRLRIRAIDL